MRPASSSPHNVPVPYSNPANVDPEEAFVAALSSCHMLWFLSFAAKHGFVVEDCVDKAEGVMEPNDCGRMAMTQITLHPTIRYDALTEGAEAVLTEHLFLRLPLPKHADSGSDGLFRHFADSPGVTSKININLLTTADLAHLVLERADVDGPNLGVHVHLGYACGNRSPDLFRAHSRTAV